jgi:hypothetical protein
MCWHLSAACLALETRVAYDTETRHALARAQPVGQRVHAIPGMGPLTATARVAAVLEATHVTNGRPWAAWLGLVPREHSTGGTPRLLGMSPRGDVDRRTRLVHGARATRRWVDTNHDDRRRWLQALLARRGKHRAAIASAHQHARMVWALLAHHHEYRVQTVVEAAGCLVESTTLRDQATWTPELMTREVRPASPNPGVRHGLRGRGCIEEETRGVHQGQQGAGGLSPRGRIDDGICPLSCGRSTVP